MRMCLSELNLYVGLLEKQYNKTFTDFNEIMEKLKYEFNIDTTIQELEDLYNPIVYEEMVDRELIWKNIFL